MLIGDLFPDSAIALDYRLSRDRPRVIHARPQGWHVVAADFEELERLLGLQAG
ncbi:hypothetical protein [Allorhizocola rhizosphaerae]|uniref:hypothetical protein n=1 Tax=Allorhizocola rhizosphaerae TaxID=1872709 RepID=UPI0013C337D0|nr:hypothetical protein [Allorhizocola rhizosphaerae]